ncbi:MAG: ketoacyl-ACP synthase III [Candidatus Delongbacteria bacterium]|jgi:3-oxoacyl-[acyl-carrier-protein] synthase-3|nr:ketoacyl-ACP synthase III [Candidatus Delongbacteria bacterium]
MGAGIKAIEYYLPESVLTNQDLSEIFKDWTAEKISSKTGIEERRIATKEECASDLAVKAARKIFDSGIITPEEIDFVILATQTPDYILPTTACMIQDRLGIPNSCGAFDFNLGCSAYIYGLAMSKALVNSNIASNVLLLTAETYSKHIHPMDKSSRTIFGDGAAATLISKCVHEIGEFDLGTDGSGYDKLIIPAGGARTPKDEKTKVTYEDNGSIRSKDNLYMAGADIFNFTIKIVPQSIKNVLEKNKLEMDDIDLFVFHQANKFMLDFLRKKVKIPEEKFIIDMKYTGNTVSPTIPIILKKIEESGKLKKGFKVLLIGFGVGLSWGSTIITW